jgi:hypothetical protein
MEQEKYPSDAAAKFMVRLPGDMRDRIAEAAKANNRSMNSEIVARLEASFNLEPLRGSKKEEFMKLVNEAIDERLALEKAKEAKGRGAAKKKL